MFVASHRHARQHRATEAARTISLIASTLPSDITGFRLMPLRLNQSSVIRRVFPPGSNSRIGRFDSAGALSRVGSFISGGGAAAAFALLHGAGNGILTIARGTLPLALYGPENDGYRLDLLGVPSRICQALAPLGFSLLMASMGGYVLIVSSALSPAAFGALLMLRKHAL